MQDNKKAITISFVAGAMLIGLVTHLMMTLLAQDFSWASRLESNELASNVIPVVVGGLVFVILQFNKATYDFMDGVVSELMKVVWPSRKDTGMMTIVVVVCLIISGVVVGVYDTVWAFVINKIIK